MHPNINIYKNIVDLSDNFSRKLAHLINDAHKKKATFNILLSGGNTPITIYDHLSDHYANKIHWEFVHFFWGDERCVPSDHIESNFGKASKHLLKKLPITLSNMHPIVGENHPYLEADRYSTLIHKHFNIINEIPSFDMVVLGMGDDGHVASLFPGQLSIFNSNRLYEVTSHPRTGQQRITATGKIINHSANVSFLVTGQNKAEILKSILDKEEGFEDLPASLVSPILGSIEWFVDQEAASKL